MTTLLLCLFWPVGLIGLGAVAGWKIYKYWFTNFRRH